MADIQCPNCGAYRIVSQGGGGCGWIGVIAIVILGIGAIGSGASEGDVLRLLGGIGLIGLSVYGWHYAQHHVQCQICGYKWDTRRQTTTLGTSQHVGRSTEATPVRMEEASSSVSKAGRQRSATERIAELDQLLADKRISEDEYEQKREEILRDI